MARQKRDFARHNPKSRTPPASSRISRWLALDRAEIHIDLTAGIVKHQEVSLGLIFQKRIYFREVSRSDSGVSLEGSVAHGNNIPGYK